MGEVVNMRGDVLLSPVELAKKLVEACEEGEVKSFVVVMETPDTNSLIWWSDQRAVDVVFASKALDIIATNLASKSMLNQGRE